MLRITFAVLLVASCLFGQSGKTVFPMEKGTWWVYAGSVWEGSEDSNAISRRRWKSEILDSVVRGRVRVALMLGHPFDLTQVSKRPGCYLMTAVDDREFYFRFLYSCAPIPDGDLMTLAVPEDLFLRLPAHKDDAVGGYEEDRSLNGWYAWHVDDEPVLSLPGIPGVPQTKSYMKYVLAFRTNPDHQVATYKAGIGLTKYDYVHHGSICVVRMHLVEFHPPQSGAKSSRRR